MDVFATTAPSGAGGAGHHAGDRAERGPGEPVDRDLGACGGRRPSRPPPPPLLSCSPDRRPNRRRSSIRAAARRSLSRCRALVRDRRVDEPPLDEPPPEELSDEFCEESRTTCWPRRRRSRSGATGSAGRSARWRGSCWRRCRSDRLPGPRRCRRAARAWTARGWPGPRAREVGAGGSGLGAAAGGLVTGSAGGGDATGGDPADEPGGRIGRGGLAGRGRCGHTGVGGGAARRPGPSCRPLRPRGSRLTPMPSPRGRRTGAARTLDEDEDVGTRRACVAPGVTEGLDGIVAPAWPVASGGPAVGATTCSAASWAGPPSCVVR